jgi:signal transduction histidine kinase
MTDDETYYALAPTELPNRRVRRYHGDDLCLPMSAFSPGDAARLRELYDYLQELLAVLAPRGSLPPAIEPFARLLERRPTDEVVSLARQFGQESYAADPSPLLAKTIHDLRGGGLSPLLGHLQFAELGKVEEGTLNVLYFAARDHLKIMRNAVLGLDDVQRELDLLPKLHGTELIVQKWQGSTVRWQDRAVRLEVDCRQQTAISECCVEFGALDRILYNLLNNACRHAAADPVRLVLVPVPDPTGDNLRFILLNEVSREDLAFLARRDLGSLFDEKTSTTGSGYGLAIVKEFVSHAFGLDRDAQAVQQGYIGARLLGERFAVWFHWPRVLED